MEPRPWPEEGATETESALLRAGRDDGPRSGADARIMAVISGASPPPALPPSPIPWVKIGLVAVVAGGAAVLTQQVWWPQQARPRAELAARQEAPVPGPAQPVPLAEEVPKPTAELEPAPAVRSGNAPPRRVAPTGRPSEASRKPAEPPADHSLGEETDALDRVRAALDVQRSAEALRLLDDYRRRFPQGRLRPEAMILQLTAFVQAGKSQAADALAGQLLSDPAYEPYVPRIQSLLRKVAR